MLAVAVSAGSAVALASPVQADSLVGVYHFESAEYGTARWTVTPCEANSGCDLLVGVTDTSDDLLSRFVARSMREDQRWNMSVDLLDSVRCEINQLTYPGRLEFSWDTQSMSGTIVSLQTTPNCGRPAMAVTKSGSFALMRIGS